MRFGITFRNLIYFEPGFPFGGMSTASASFRLVSLDVHTDESVWHMLFQLTALTHLTLDLQHNFAEVSQQHLAQQPPPHRCLPKLVDLFINFTSDVCTGLLMAGYVLPSLTRLDLSGDDDPVASCSLAHLGACTRLQHLNLEPHAISQVTRCNQPLSNAFVSLSVCPLLSPSCFKLTSQPTCRYSQPALQYCNMNSGSRDTSSSTTIWLRYTNWSAARRRIVTAGISFFLAVPICVQMLHESLFTCHMLCDGLNLAEA